MITANPATGYATATPGITATRDYGPGDQVAVYRRTSAGHGVHEDWYVADANISRPDQPTTGHPAGHTTQVTSWGHGIVRSTTLIGDLPSYTVELVD